MGASKATNAQNILNQKEKINQQNSTELLEIVIQYFFVYKRRCSAKEIQGDSILLDLRNC